MLTDDTLAGVAERAQELELLGDALVRVSEAIDTYDAQLPAALLDLRRAFAGLPIEFNELRELPLGPELWLTANVARQIAADAEAGRRIADRQQVQPTRTDP